jgi:hypothetical protein
LSIDQKSLRHVENLCLETEEEEEEEEEESRAGGKRI